LAGELTESATENSLPIRLASFASGTEAMVKRWGKSPPALRVTEVARQTPGGARSNREALGFAQPGCSTGKLFGVCASG